MELNLLDYTPSKNPVFPYWKYKHIDWDEITEDECNADFRFQKADMDRIKEALRLPDDISIANRKVVPGKEALAILCRRFAYPCRYSDMIPRFGRSVPDLSLICSYMTEYLDRNYGHLLVTMQQDWLSPINLERMAVAIHAKGAPLTNCWGFPDGTVRPICRPEEDQGLVYNGHKRTHALKYQAISTPSGVIAHLFGPIEATRHDCYLLNKSGLLDQLERFSRNTKGEPMCIYGDKGYPNREFFQAPFKGRLTEEQDEYNTRMSRCRVGVEWSFKEITSYFKFIDFKKNQKLGLQAVGLQYRACALLQNMRTCLYGSQSSEFFDFPPPALEEYLVEAQ